jgi:CAAX protease family protein
MSPLREWARRHRLVVFFGLAIAFAWCLWPFWALGLAPVPFLPGGPLVAALVVISVTEGRSGFRELGARMIRWRVGWRWWVVAVGTPLAVLAVATAANVSMWGAPVPVLADMGWSGIALVFASRFVDPMDGPLGEEPGWRGYALPQLQAARSPWGAGMILTPLVVVWHLPLVVVGQLDAVGLAGTAGITLVYVWLFNHTGGSVLLTMVFHVVQGTISYAALGFTGVDAVRMAWIASGLWCALAVVLILFDRPAWREAPPAATADRDRVAPLASPADSAARRSRLRARQR